MTMARLSFIVLLCSLLVPSIVSADTIAVCDTIPRQGIQDVTLTIDVPQFPYAECTLLDAQVVLNIVVDGQFFGENTGNCGPLGCSWSDSIYVSLALNDLDGSPLDTDFSYTDSGTVTGYDGVFDFGGTSGYTSPFFWNPFNNFVMTYPDLTLFQAPVSIPIDTSAWVQLMNPGNGSYGVSTYIEGTVCVTYTYECVTNVEPSTWGAIKRLSQ